MSVTPLSNMLTTRKILYRVLLVVFLVEIVNELVAWFGPVAFEFQPLQYHLFESIILVAALCPILWFVIARPIQRFAEQFKRQNDLLLSEMVEAVIAVDGSERVSGCNQAAERIFAANGESLMGRPVRELFDDAENAYARLISLPDGTPDVLSLSPLKEVRGRRLSGEPFFMEVSLSRLSSSERADAVLLIRDISERKQAEQERAHLLSLMESTLQSTADGIAVLDTERRIVVYNRKYSEMWGVAELLAAGSPTNCINDVIRRQLCDAQEFDGHVCHLFEKADTVYSDLLHLKDGRIIERVCTPQTVDGVTVGRVSCYRDVTERFTAQRAMAESETRFRQIFEQSADGIFLFDAACTTVMDLNQVALKIFCYDPDELLGGGLGFLFTEEELRFVRRQTSEVHNDVGYWVDIMRARRKDGTEMYISVRCRMIELIGQQAILCTIRDISERVRAEEATRAIEAKLIQTNKMTSLGVLVAGIAHEINNPNNFIMLSSELLSKAWKDANPILAEYGRQHGDFELGGVSYQSMKDEIPDLLENITEGGRRIRDIVNGLKNFAREGKQGMRDDLNINQVIQQATTIINHQIRRHTHKFSIAVEPEIPLVTGNPQQIEQVVINLIMNALQSLPDPERQVVVRSSYDRQLQTVSIEVADQGRGIPDEISGRVLEPFFSTRLDRGGTGLGLSISHSIIRDHNGSLTFGSSPAGTTFLIQLPVSRQPISEEPEHDTI